MTKKYGNESIKALKGGDRIRKRPEVMLSSRDIEAMKHTLTEMLDNGLDEADAGYGDNFIITYCKDYSIKVRDFGRGVPLGWNEGEQRYNWDLIYNELYAGGKYDEIDDDIFDKIDTSDKKSLENLSYLFPIGLNGLGAYATQASSVFFEVCSYHNEVHGDASTPMVRSRMRFEEGNPVLDELEVTPTDEPRGTLVHWKPDITIFRDSNTEDIGIDWIVRYCEETAHIRGYDFKIIDENTGKEYNIHGEGIVALLKKDAGDKLRDDKILHKEDWRKGRENRLVGTVTQVSKYLMKLEVAIAFTTDKVGIHCFHNSRPLKRGSSYQGIDSAFQQFFSEIARENNVKIRSDDYEELITASVSTFSTVTSYEGQTKYGITSSHIFSFVEDTVLNMLRVEYGKGNHTLKKIINEIIQNAATRVKIKQYEKQQREANKITRNRKKNIKLTECEWTDPEKIEIHIVEGDSAGGAEEKARDSRFQAILPLVGKFINCLKRSVDDILSNPVIQDISQALGCGMDLPGSSMFDIRKLKYGNIYIDTDADDDGSQIQMLCFAYFYVLAPELLRQGRVHITLTPLFKIDLMNGQTVFAYNNEEQRELVEKHRGMIRNIQRIKGLGETNPDVLWDTALNPETRRVITLKIDSRDKDCERLIDTVFGKDRTHSRKKLLLDLLKGEEVDTDTTEQEDGILGEIEIE